MRHALAFALAGLPLTATAKIEITEAFACEVPAICTEGGNCMEDLTPFHIAFATGPDCQRGAALLTPVTSAPAAIGTDPDGATLLTVTPQPDMPPVATIRLTQTLQVRMTLASQNGEWFHDGDCTRIDPASLPLD